MSARLVICVSAFAVSFVSPFAATAQAVGASPKVEWRRVGATPGFPHLRSALATIAAAHGSADQAIFCVVLRDSGDNDPLVFALWPAAHLLYRWRGTRDAYVGDATLLHHQPLELRRDIVRSASDDLSNYKVSKAWIDDVGKQCRQHGEEVRIERRVHGRARS